MARSAGRLAFLLLGAVLASFGLSPARAEDGGYPNMNTVEGDFAMYYFVTNATSGGFSNTAIGRGALELDADGWENTATGSGALQSNTTGWDNTAIGVVALDTNSTGNYNTAIGAAALENNTVDNNTATGFGALRNNTTASGNTADGYKALYSNTVGYENTATGFQALYKNIGGSYPQGSFNTAHGWGGLYSNTSGYSNTATGAGALYFNDSGYDNTANGCVALYNNTSGYHNTVNGVGALYYNKTGYNNTANGWSTLNTNTAGFNNTAEGFDALFHSTGSNNVAVGGSAGSNITTGSNNIIIGANLLGNSADANVTRIGSTTQKKTFIGGIYNKTVASGVGVIVNSSGQLGTVQSSARFKDDIKPMDKASEAILALKPVTFRYKVELDPDKIPQFGLIAEQVEKVNPDLVVRGEDGKVMSVRYEAVNAMLLNEFLKEHRSVQELKGIVARQQKQIEVLTATVQKVSEQLELNKPTSRLIAND